MSRACVLNTRATQCDITYVRMYVHAAMEVETHKTRISTKVEDSSCVCITRDGKLLSGHDSMISVWSECLVSQEWRLLHTVHTPIGGEVTCIAQFPSQDHLYAVSVNNCIAIYDLQQMPKFVRHFRCNCEEINQLDINSKGTFLCAGDDSGEIKVIDIENGSLYKTLSRRHNNICSTVKFNPRKSWEVISGGLDCQLVRWDFSLGRPLCSLSTQEMGGSHSESYLVNPPMVHSIDIIPSKFCVVCGLGSGVVAIYGLKTPKSMTLECTASLHTLGVGSLCVLDASPLLEDPLVISGGNDRRVVVSKLKVVSNSSQPQYSKADTSFHLEKVVEVEHGCKVNFLSARRVLNDKNDRVLFVSVFVADPSCFVSRYKIPC